ncbi:MAG: cellulase [Bacteroidetes bacterium]|nr:cellulase [Bacteroidota bacterium]
MKTHRPIRGRVFLGLVVTLLLYLQLAAQDRSVHSYGALVREDTSERIIYLVFTGHEFADGGAVIRRTLLRHNVLASFFFTGDFYRNPSFMPLIRRLRDDGHYLGPHSDKHLLYVCWEKRDSLLITREQFARDLEGNFRAMAQLGIRREDAFVFLPPYEWYNDSIAAWTRSLGSILVNFTPGTLSNADYTIPSMGSRYISSDSIYRRILAYERSSPSGLNGFFLLLHIGTHPDRTDKFYTRLDSLLSALKKAGYIFRRFPPRKISQRQGR